MTAPQHPIPPNPVSDALNEAIDEDTGDETQDMLVEVIDAVWYGFDAPETVQSMVDQRIAHGLVFDVDKVKATIDREFAKKRAAEAQWPAITDFDKLERAFVRMHEQGICALHCPGDTQQQGFDAVDEVLAEDGTPKDHYHGYCFYHSQDLDCALDNEGLELAHGHVDGVKAKQAKHLAVARAICEILRQEGLEVEWNGSTRGRINQPSFRWQRRSPV